MKNPFKNRRSCALLFSVIYALIGFLLLSLSSTISAIILFTLAIVLVLEPWIHFSGKKLGFNRPLAIFIGVVALFLGLAVLSFYLVPLVVRQATNFYTLVYDFFPADDGSSVSVLDYNTVEENIDEIFSSKDTIDRLEKAGFSSEQFDEMKQKIKDYYKSVYEESEIKTEVNLKRELEENLNLPENTYVVIIGGDQKQEQIEETYLENILQSYLPVETADYLEKELLNKAVRVESKENWRKFTEALMPKVISPERKEEIINNTRNLLISLQAQFREYISLIFQKIPSMISSAFTVIFFVILGTVYLSYYFPLMKRYSVKLYPNHSRSVASDFMKDTYRSLQRYVNTILVISLMVGFLVGIVVKLLSLDYSILMGFWAAITNLIPIVGVALEVIPLFLLAASVQNLGILIVLALVLIAVHSIAFVFFLKLMKGYGRINSVAIIFMIIIFGQILGVVGVFIAVPIAIAFKHFWEHFISPWLDGKELT
ncbi:MAG: AI-2E family transporter [Thermotogota bacterium]|nr:AI-2E family transporter [Thermotogota bacterium]